MRFFLALSYLGKQYCGWQIQPHAPSVQETIENAIFTITRNKIELVGCGRTDTGVHASQYYAHFDIAQPLPKSFLQRLNKVLPKDIAIQQLIPVHADAHARFDATYRAYEYHIVGQKNPFLFDTATFCYNFEQIDPEKLQVAANLIAQFEAFAPFCKTNSDAHTMNCTIFRSEWEWDIQQKKGIYHIAANRFLRGMVRLIVGMCLNVATDKISLEEVRFALEHQLPLKKSESAAPEGLFLSDIRYPYIHV